MQVLFSAARVDEEGHIVMDYIKLLYHGYNDISELTTEELKTLIVEILNIEEVAFGIDELYKREPESAITLGKNILEDKLGDVYLQASIFSIT
jgi:hypothetical protein